MSIRKVRSFVFLDYEKDDAAHIFDKISLVHNTYNSEPQAYPKQLLQKYNDKVTGMEIENPFYVFAQ